MPAPGTVRRFCRQFLPNNKGPRTMTFPVVPREQCRFVFTIDGVYKHSGTHLEEPIQRLARVYVPQLAAEANREPQPQTFGFAIWWEKTRPYLKLWLECINDRGARSDLGKNQRVADYLTPNLPTEFECCAGLLREDWQLILHVFNHHTEHRAQVALVLAMNGIDVGSLDFSTFLRER